MLLKETLEKNRTHKALLLHWISALLLRIGIKGLMRTSCNETYNQEFYSLLTQFFTENPIQFLDRTLNFYVEKITSFPYESGWFHLTEIFLEQMRASSIQLKQAVFSQGLVYLWGLGKRGEAFQRFCGEQNIELNGVADIKNDNVGRRTAYGNAIIHTGILLQGTGLIVASNQKIYQYLLEKNPDLKVLNLEEFCPD